MTDRIRGPDKRVEGSNWSRRTRSNRLNEERADDKLHLAEFEEFVRNEHEQRRHREPADLPEEERPAPLEPPTDTVELHETPVAPANPPQPPPPADSREDEDPPRHLDITA